MDHTGARDAPEVTTADVQQHTHQLNASTQEHYNLNQKQQVRAEQADNHQPKHDAALSSTATGFTEHGEIGCQVRKEAEKQSIVTGSSQDTQNTTVEVGMHNPQACRGLVTNENNSKFDEFTGARTASVYLERTDTEEEKGSSAGSGAGSGSGAHAQEHQPSSPSDDGESEPEEEGETGWLRAHFEPAHHGGDNICVLRVCIDITVDALLSKLSNFLNWEAGATLHPDDLCRLTPKKGIVDLFGLTPEGLFVACVTILRVREEAEATTGEGSGGEDSGAGNGSGAGTGSGSDVASVTNLRVGEETVTTADVQQKTVEEPESAVQTVSNSA